MRDKQKNENRSEEIEEILEEAPEAPEQTPEETAAPEQGSPADPLAELQKQYDELNDRHMRLMAEYDNFRKRSQKEKDDIYPNATAAALQKFLPVLDNLDRASEFDYNTEDFAKGFDMICQNFREIMESFGVEEVGAAGETFDPNFHNAAMHIEDESLGANVISQVFQKGYKIGDRVIRYAMVQTAN